jgi:hypothetical protein
LAKIVNFNKQEACQYRKGLISKVLQTLAMSEFGKAATSRGHELGISTSCCKCDIAMQH